MRFASAFVNRLPWTACSCPQGESSVLRSCAWLHPSLPTNAHTIRQPVTRPCQQRPVVLINCAFAAQLRSLLTACMPVRMCPTKTIALPTRTRTPQAECICTPRRTDLAQCCKHQLHHPTTPLNIADLAQFLSPLRRQAHVMPRPGGGPPCSTLLLRRVHAVLLLNAADARPVGGVYCVPHLNAGPIARRQKWRGLCKRVH